MKRLIIAIALFTALSGSAMAFDIMIGAGGGLFSPSGEYNDPNLPRAIEYNNGYTVVGDFHFYLTDRIGVHATGGVIGHKTETVSFGGNDYDFAVFSAYGGAGLALRYPVPLFDVYANAGLLMIGTSLELDFNGEDVDVPTKMGFYADLGIRFKLPLLYIAVNGRYIYAKADIDSLFPGGGTITDYQIGGLSVIGTVGFKF